jgi:hypothetical protein
VNPEAILQYLEMLANNNLTVNLLMHMVVIAALLSLYLAKSFSFARHLFQGSICLLLLSVTIHAFIFGNIFHALTFGLFTLIALVQLARPKQDIKVNANRIQTVIALFFIIIGLWYPEFIEKNAVMLLLFSPVGVIPCPTLLSVLGLLTLTYPSSGKFQYGFAIFMGLIYGVIGIFVLKVYLDITLLILVLYAFYIYWTAPKNGDH